MQKEAIKTNEELFRLFSRNDYDAMDSIRLYMISSEKSLLDTQQNSSMMVYLLSVH